MTNPEPARMILAASHEWHTGDSTLIDADCGHKCWITPESKTALADNPHIASSCLPCAGLSAADLLKGELEVHAVPGQREALNKLWGEAATDAAFKKLNIRED